MSDQRRRPTAFDLEDVDLGGPLRSEDEIDAVAEDGELAATLSADVPPLDAVAERKRGIPWAKILGAGVSGLVSIAIGVWVQRLIADLFATVPILGWIAFIFAIIAALGLVGFIVAEAVMLSRIARIEELRKDAIEVVRADDRPGALRILRALMALYDGRPETARGRSALARHMGEVIDGRDLVALAERELLTTLDRRAVAQIVASAKRVSVVTALSPRALVDIAYVAIEATGLVRRIALTYGGRPGMLGFLRVLRHAIAHLAVTGGIAAGDTLIQDMVGHGLATRLSARLGEGFVNGLMTARLGIATLDVVRPLPFIEAQRPRVPDIVAELTRMNAEAQAKRDERRLKT